MTEMYMSINPGMTHLLSYFRCEELEPGCLAHAASQPDPPLLSDSQEEFRGPEAGQTHTDWLTLNVGGRCFTTTRYPRVLCM